MWKILLGALLVALVVYLRSRLAAFPAQSPSDYRSDRGDIVLSEHLTGELICHGVLYGPTGRVVSRFIADMSMTWDGNRGRLEELFTYDSGNTQSRVWDLEVQEGGRVVGTASDFEGQAVGQISGSTLHLKYRFRLPEEQGGYVLDVVDWMYLLEDGTFVNRSQFRKFGIKVAELVATFQPKG